MSDNGKPIIVWGEPPRRASSTGRPRKYAAIAEELKRNPGQWGCVARDENRKPLQTACTALTKGKGYQRQARPGRIEAVTRRTRDGDDYGLWARWVPPGGDS